MPHSPKARPAESRQMSTRPRRNRQVAPLRVLHVSPAPFGEDGVFGGGERFPFKLAKAMSDVCQVTLLTFGERRCSSRDGHLHIQGGQANRYLEGIGGESTLGRPSPAIAAADVIHVHQWETVVANQCVLLGRLLGKRVFATDLGGSGPNYWRKFRLHRLLTGFIALSSFGATFYPEMQDRMRISLGGVDLTRFNADARVEREYRALFVGRLLPHKGIDRLIDALPATVPLLVIGRPYDPSYRRVLQDKALGKQVEFRQDVDDDGLVAAYRSSRVALLPSVYDPSYGPQAPRSELLGLTLVEAMACGTPVICTDVGGMPELVEHDRSGFVVDPNDPSAITTAVCALLADDALWARMSDAALARARELSWDLIAQNCLGIYQDPFTSLVQGP